MLAEEQIFNVVCPREEELICDKATVDPQCPVAECGKVIKNSSAMKMHLAQTHGIGAENVLQTFNKAFIVANKATKSVYACPVFTCSRTFGSNRYFKTFTTLRDHYLSMHAEKKHICNKCGVKFGNPKRLEQHGKICKKVYYCTCGCPFKKKETLLEHSVGSQHELPEDVKLEMFHRSGIKMGMERNDKRVSMKVGEQPAHNSSNSGSSISYVLQSKPLFIVPQDITIEKQMKPNAFLVLSCTNTGSTVENSVESAQRQTADSSFKILDSNRIPVIEETVPKVTMSGYQIPPMQTNNIKSDSEVESNTMNARLMNKGSPNNVTKKAIPSPRTDTASYRNSEQLMDKFSKQKNVLKAMPLESTEANARRKLPDLEKLKRVDEAMKQYVPIKKKDPLDPVISDWHCSVPRRKYKKRKRKIDDRSNSFVVSGAGNDEASVSSMQDCLQKASSFVKNMLPKMKSPNRGISPDRIAPGYERLRNESWQQESGLQKTQTQTEQKITESMSSNTKNQRNNFEKPLRLPVVAVEKNTTSKENTCNLMTYKGVQYQCSSASLHEGTNNGPVICEDGILENDSTSDQQTVSGEFSLDNLTPELLFDIETQTEDFSSYFSDAFTQTMQQSAKLIATSNQNYPGNDTGNDFGNNTCWVNNNQTQTDNISQFIVDAFTQTRIGLEENESLSQRGGQNSMADNHTQTILSSDNFFKNFSFGADDETLDSSIMPDLIDICTQTAPDPNFDELLALCSTGAQTSSSFANA